MYFLYKNYDSLINTPHTKKKLIIEVAYFYLFYLKPKRIYQLKTKSQHFSNIS